MKIKNKKNFILGIVLICMNIIGLISNISRGQDFSGESPWYVLGSFLLAIVGIILIVKSCSSKIQSEKSIKEKTQKEEDNIVKTKNETIIKEKIIEKETINDNSIIISIVIIATGIFLIIISKII